MIMVVCPMLFGKSPSVVIPHLANCQRMQLDSILLAFVFSLELNFDRTHICARFIRLPYIHGWAVIINMRIFALSTMCLHGM